MNLDKLAVAIETLRLSKRSELQDKVTETDLSKTLYVDPRANNGSLERLKRPGHALVQGRKGTGKSTLFQRFQYEVREGHRSVSAYLDVKALFTRAQFSSVQEAVGSGQDAADASYALELCLWRSFLALFVTEIIKELPSPAEPTSMLGRIAALFGRQKDNPADHFASLADINRYIERLDIDRFKKVVIEDGSGEEDVSQSNVGVAVNLSETPAILSQVTRGGHKAKRLHTLNREPMVAMQQFRADKFVDELVIALDKAGLERLHLIVDDFSELPQDAMRLFARCILEPFVGSSRVDLQACKLEYSIVSPK